MTETAEEVRQWPCKPVRTDLTLIPPLAEEFGVYGGADTVERARKWALYNHYLLAETSTRCAHGLYLMTCPGMSCLNHFRQLDHANIWVPATPEHGRPFLLSAPYADKITQETHQYALAHGLVIPAHTNTFREWNEYADPEGKIWAGDDWYSESTLPIRMNLPESWPLWPIEAEAAILLSTQPVKWPDDPS